jgi:Ca2+-binding RTX toxin-like protein
VTGTGNALVNLIVGTAGDNVLDGLGGNDVLTGGLGKDRFTFDTAISKDASVNLDRIADFLHGTDQIDLSKAIFKKLALGALDKDAFFKGKHAADHDDRIGYDKNHGLLLYDKDGDGKGKAIAFAHFDSDPGHLNQKDFLVIA